MKRARKSRLLLLSGATLVLVVHLTACGVNLTPFEEQLYASYLADSEAPYIEDPEPNSPGAAFALSAIFPPLGHWYNGRFFAGLMWGTFGLWLWPFMIPATSACHDADKLNMKHVVREYRKKHRE